MTENINKRKNPTLSNVYKYIISFVYKYIIVRLCQKY